MLSIATLVFRGCGLTPAVGAAELLSRASALHQGLEQAAPPAEVVMVAAADERAVRTDAGLRIECQASLADELHADLVVVPAFDGELLSQLAANRAVIPWIRRQYERGATVASICTGTFALAEAGLLTGRAATTHWAAQELLQQRYPAITLRRQEIVVDEGRVITSGGAYSYTNLIIHLVRRLLGTETALQISRICLIDLAKSPQGSYAMFQPPLTHEDPNILEAQNVIERGIGDDLTVEGLADSVALSRRQFLRRFKSATGMTPQRYLQLARIEAAKQALIRTRSPVDEIASTVGYADTPGFRRLFVRITGLTPTEFRRRNRAFTTPALAGPAPLTRKARSQVSEGTSARAPF